MISPISSILLMVAFVAAGLVFGRLVARRGAELRAASTRTWLETIRTAAESQSAEIRRAAEITAREEAEMAGAAFEAISQVRENELSGRQAQFDARRKTIERLEGEVVARRKRMDLLQAGARTRDENARRLGGEAAAHERGRTLAVESRAGISRAGLRASII